MTPRYNIPASALDRALTKTIMRWLVELLAEVRELAL